MYRVRPARADDRDVIAQFNLAMALETEAIELDPLTLNSGVRAVLEDPGKGFYLVCEHDGEAVGSLMITFEWSDWRNGNIWWLQSVYVDPAHRRKGVFSLLFNEVKERIQKAKDIAGARLYVDEHNASAIKTYLAKGMKLSNYKMLELMK